MKINRAKSLKGRATAGFDIKWCFHQVERSKPGDWRLDCREPRILHKSFYPDCIADLYLHSFFPFSPCYDLLDLTNWLL